jgi:hypothetical protein
VFSIWIDLLCLSAVQLKEIESQSAGISPQLTPNRQEFGNSSDFGVKLQQ